MAVWRVDSRTIGGTLVKQGLDVRGFSCRWVLNAPGSWEADAGIDLVTAAQAKPGEHRVEALRDGTIVWGGDLWDASVDVDARDLKLGAEGYFGRLRRRRVTSDLIYAATNQQQIAWNLIAHTQGQSNGALGFTQGAHVGANVTRKRFYCAAERPSIGEEIEKLGDFDDGLDFEVGPTKVFKTWTGKRGSASGISLDGTKLTRVTYKVDMRDAVSHVTAIGQGDCAPVVEDVTDATAAAAFGRLQDVVESEVDVDTEVQAEAREELRSRKDGHFTAEVSFRDGGTGAPAWGTYGLGDTLTLSDDRGYATFSKTLRIMEIGLDVEPPSLAMVTLVLDSAVS